MFHTPPHKQLDPDKQPGQIHLEPLGDYIARVQREEAFNSVAKEKKLSCNEWVIKNPPKGLNTTGEFMDYIQLVWKSAQDNK